MSHLQVGPGIALGRTVFCALSLNLMRKLVFTFPGALLSAVLFPLLAPAAFAVTTPALMLSDGSNTITIDGSGAVAYGGTCTPTTCTTTSVSASSGQLVWSGTIGAFKLSPGGVVGTT